ncbi:MAG TPA: efflux RND transporter periplasmic adaptor subunit [Kofleriaceae bacterium]|nr:efflux RND transporter periplasmic adaptor subunit [Kofleriaceae bacterium]
MIPTRIFVRLALASASALAGCGGGGHADHDEHRGDDDGPPSTSFTTWSPTHEVFAEYPILVVGGESRLAAHVTTRKDHRPVAAGSVMVELRQADGSTVSGTASAPEPAGIFRPAVTPTVAGPCKLTVTLAATDPVTIDECVVYPDAKAIPRAPDEPAGRIAFLKEQAWTMDFGVDDAGTHELTPTLRASGEIRATAGREARITASTAGRVVLAAPAPVLGMRIEKGQVLGTVHPRLPDSLDRSTLGADLRQLRAELGAAEAQLARDERLAADGAIPTRQLEESRTRVEVSRARLAGAEGRLAQFDAGAAGRTGGGRTAFQLRSPLAGTLVEIHPASGQSVENGEALFTVVDLSRVWVHADIFEPDIARVVGATRASFKVDGHEQPFEIAPPDGAVVTVGNLVNEKTRTVPMIFEVGNADGRLRIGSFATVFIATGAPRAALAVPDSAIVDDAGREVVYVQAEGESFERRVVTVGIRSGGWTEITSGLAAGEHVVTRGAYAIKLAAAGGAVPSHGHAH